MIHKVFDTTYINKWFTVNKSVYLKCFVICFSVILIGFIFYTFYLSYIYTGWLVSKLINYDSNSYYYSYNTGFYAGSPFYYLVINIDLTINTDSIYDLKYL